MFISHDWNDDDNPIDLLTDQTFEEKPVMTNMMLITLS